MVRKLEAAAPSYATVQERQPYTTDSTAVMSAPASTAVTTAMAASTAVTTAMADATAVIAVTTAMADATAVIAVTAVAPSCAPRL